MGIEIVFGELKKKVFMTNPNLRFTS